jgi:hypothetical protein
LIASLAINDLEVYDLVLFKITPGLASNTCPVNEELSYTDYIVLVLNLDEAIAFFRAEPTDDALVSNRGRSRNDNLWGLPDGRNEKPTLPERGG